MRSTLFLVLLALFFAVAIATELHPLRKPLPHKMRELKDCASNNPCSSTETCCNVSGGQTGCCPAPNACCCPDQQHCCAQGKCVCSGFFFGAPGCICLLLHSLSVGGPSPIQVSLAPMMRVLGWLKSGFNVRCNVYRSFSPLRTTLPLSTAPAADFLSRSGATPDAVP